MNTLSLKVRAKILAPKGYLPAGSEEVPIATYKGQMEVAFEDPFALFKSAIRGCVRLSGIREEFSVTKVSYRKIVYAECRPKALSPAFLEKLSSLGWVINPHLPKGSNLPPIQTFLPLAPVRAAS
jgi:hypothetical protein